MPIIDNSDYKPSVLFRSGHINTMYPYLFRRTRGVSYDRVKLDMPDGDFMHVDTILGGHSRLVILMHGLEGHSKSQYMLSNAKHYSNRNWDVIAVNHRSCSGIINNKPYAYHSGWTQDLDHIIGLYEGSYDDIVILGFSLGANISLKYCSDGVYTVSPKVKAVIAVSTPIDLRGCSRCISSKENFAYQKMFLFTLKKKMLQKAPLYPEYFDSDRIRKIKTLKEFDDVLTGPVHGFESGEDYYDKCSSKQFLENLRIPTLLIQAEDDSFLSAESYPYELAQDSQYLHLMVSKYGGHVGFTTFGEPMYWYEQQILQFIDENISHTPIRLASGK